MISVKMNVISLYSWVYSSYQPLTCFLCIFSTS